MSQDTESIGHMLELESLVTNLPGIVYRSWNEPGWPMEFVDGQCEEITGYSAAELESEAVCWGEDVIHPDDRDWVQDPVEAALSADEAFELQYRIQTAAGNTRWVWEQGRSVDLQRDGTQLLEGFIMDVTDRQEQSVQLQKIDRMLRHNLRNDMNVVLAQAEQIRSAAEGPLEESAEQIIDTIHSLLEKVQKERKILRLLDDESDREPIDLMTIIRGEIVGLRDEWPAADIELIGPETVSVLASPHLSLAFEEILENAIEHSNAEMPETTASVTVNPTTVTVEVTDNGPGIPEMEVDLISDTREETPLSHGQGMGLWLVQLLVRRSGGSLDFSTNEEGGSTVTITLERADPKPDA
jgi:PAS domain S-box-containing protein